MASPDTYTVATGLSIYGGHDGSGPVDPPPEGLPLWAAAAPLNAWMEIPGTSGAGGTSIESYSGWAKLPEGRLGITLAGGHGDGTRNSTAVIDLLEDAPAWVEVGPPSPAHIYDVAYQADGKPTTSHTYYTTMWVPTTNRLMRIGCTYASGEAVAYFPTVDGINLDVSPALWDAEGTHPNLPSGGAGALYNPILNKVLIRTDYAGDYFDPVTGINTPITAPGITFMPRAPWAWDTTRNQAFGLCYGDNQRSSTGLGVVAAKIVGTVATQITIAAGAVKDQFIADSPEYAAMEYDPNLDCFLFYWGASEATRGRVYKVTPNDTTTWGIELFTYGSGGITPAVNPASGIVSKFSYIPELGGIVMMAKPINNLYFMRTT